MESQKEDESCGGVDLSVKDAAEEAGQIRRVSQKIPSSKKSANKCPIVEDNLASSSISATATKRRGRVVGRTSRAVKHRVVFDY